MRLTRRGFLGGAVAGGAMFALPRLVRAQGGGSSYSVAVLGDTHFDQALDPDFVASYGASLPAGTARFPLAKRKSSVSDVRFAGDGVLTSIFGEYGKKDWFNVIVR